MRIIYGLFCLCFLVFFHELGHFLFARLFGVKVEAFSIGFGPVLFHKTKNQTDYRLSLLPLGGYCAMKGEQDFKDSLESGLSYINADKDSLYGVHPIKRVLIAFAGPFFNFIFAFIALTIIFMIGYSYYSYSNKIMLPDETYPNLHSVAKEAGILDGDRIIKVNENQTNDFSDLIKEIGTRGDEDIIITVQRNEEIMDFKLHTDLDKETGSGKIGIMADKNTLQKKESPTYSLFPAMYHGLLECFSIIKLTFKGIQTLFKGVELTKAVSGPARIADMMGDVIQQSFSENLRIGFVNMLNFMALISLSLFIMNLLPIPVLDGGLILFALIETIFNRKISPKVLYYIQFVGLFFIAVLFIIGLTGDIHYFIDFIKNSK